MIKLKYIETVCKLYIITISSYIVDAHAVCTEVKFTYNVFINTYIYKIYFTKHKHIHFFETSYI